MTLKNNRAPLLFYFKLVASFRNHWCIETWVTVRKRPIWVKIDDFFSRVTSKFDVWPWKTIGHLFYATSSFVHHFIAIGEFKLELKSGNAQSGSNSTIFSAVWPWNVADDLEQGKSEGFDSCNLPGNLAQILSKSSIFQPVWLIDWFFISGFQRSMAYQAGLLKVHIQYTGFNSQGIHIHLHELLQLKKERKLKNGEKRLCESN